MGYISVIHTTTYSHWLHSIPSELLELPVVLVELN